MSLVSAVALITLTREFGVGYGSPIPENLACLRRILDLCEVSNGGPYERSKVAYVSIRL
jgi:hypothetical protein